MDLQGELQAVVQDGNEVDIFENKGVYFVKLGQSSAEFKFEIRI